MTTHRLKQFHCPLCNHAMDSTEPEDNAITKPPASGDLTICFRCAVPLIFNEDLTVREITDQEMKDLSPEEFDQLTRVQSEIYHFNLPKTKKP